ncbi:MAG: hypothetical protein JJU11_09350 [Candidatus Sumerlaeia bacterium]|nr:hypothetical protein [Candidatus Sumerlaeia bacterium]
MYSQGPNFNFGHHDGLRPSNLGRDGNSWYNDKEEENPWDFDPFAGGPAPFSKRKKKMEDAPKAGEPEVFHLDDQEVTKEEPAQEPSVEKTPTPSTVTKPKQASTPPSDGDLPHVFVPDNPDEVINPYDPPQAKTNTGTKTHPANKPKISSLPEYQPPSKFLRYKERFLDALPPLPILIGIGGLVLVVFIVYLMRPLFQKSALDNLPPVAVLTPPESLQIRENDRIILDASQSHDPEGESISYQWNMIAEEGVEVIFSQIDDSRRRRTRQYITSTPKVRVHFIDPGEVTISLRVNDGLLFSDSVEATFQVTPLNNQQ